MHIPNLLVIPETVHKLGEYGAYNFSRIELADPTTGECCVEDMALARLQMAREAYGYPIKITSAYRSPKHNQEVHGAAHSYHMKGEAFDIKTPQGTLDDRRRLFQAVQRAGFTGIGLYKEHLHVDTGPCRYWVGFGETEATKFWMGVP